jgi:hypothetical protein
MANPGERIGDHDRINELVARLAPLTVGFNLLVSAVELLAGNEPADARGDVLGLAAEARRLAVEAEVASDAIVNASAPFRH